MLQYSRGNPGLLKEVQPVPVLLQCAHVLRPGFAISLQDIKEGRRMFTRQHRKHQFHVELPQPPRRGSEPFGVAVTHRRTKQRFRVGPPKHSRQKTAKLPRSLPFALVIARHLPRRTSLIGTTLAQRRIRRRALIFTLACVALIAVMGSGLYVVSRSQPLARIRTPSRTSSVAVAELSVGMVRTQHNLLTRPFASLVPTVPVNGQQPPAIQAASAFLFDPGRNLVFYEKNSDMDRPIASLTKVMTLLVASGTGNLDQPVTIGPDAAALVNSNNSYMGVSVGEQFTLRDLLYGLMLASGNDAAVAIADALDGSVPAFVADMNFHAEQLGLVHTSFVSPDGLDDGNRSTARDLAVLTAIALERPEVEQITSARTYNLPATATHGTYNMVGSNDLLPGGSAPYPGANGVKTGYTAGALYCLAFSARRNGHLIVGVVLGEPSAEARLSDARALLDWGFAQE